MNLYLGIIGAFIGLVVSSYIYRQKKKKVKLVCPREASCEKVVHSTYGTTFGIGNDVLGIAYYTVVGIIHVAMVVFPGIAIGPVVWVLTLMTISGALFSLYLIALQAIVIRAWCMWCLGSAFGTLLLVLSLFSLESTTLFPLLASQKLLWVIVHNIGFILGLGAVTITDIFFFRFLKDEKISEEEKGTMDTLTNVIWVGLAILVISGIMLYLPEQARLDASPKFMLKVVVIGVVIINGLLLNMKVAPRMRSFSFSDTVPARHFRCLAFALGAVSLTSWYVAFFLGSFRKIHLSFLGGLGVYVGLVVCAVIGSQIFESILERKRRTLLPPSL